MKTFDRAGIAQRLRNLLGLADIEGTASRLGLSEVSLRMSVDEDSPHPTVEVLAAVVREYGVDPSWLLTGVYDASTHRNAMEQDDGITETLRAQVDDGKRRIADPLTHPTDQRDTDD